MKTPSGLVAGLLALSFVAGDRARADSRMFTDRGAWTQACNGLANIDFEGIAPPGQYVFYGSPEGLTIAGINFVGHSGSSYILWVVDPALHREYYDWGSGAVLVGSSPEAGPANICVNLNKGFTCVGTDVMSFNYPTGGYGDTIAVALSTGETFSVATCDYPNRAFIGFTSDVPITSMSFTPTGTYSWPELDNFAFGDIRVASQRTGAVVEPPSGSK